MGACTTKCAIFCVDKYSNCIDYMNNEGQYNENPPNEIKINLPPNIQQMIRKPYNPPDVQQNIEKSETLRNIQQIFTLPLNQSHENEKTETHQNIQQIFTLPVNKSHEVEKKDCTDKSNSIKKVSSYNNLDEDFEIIN
jgi:hypothetical protein